MGRTVRMGLMANAWLRDEASSVATRRNHGARHGVRGLKPTATVIASLRDATLRCQQTLFRAKNLRRSQNSIPGAYEPKAGEPETPR
jgi:hypothetical protein